MINNKFLKYILTTYTLFFAFLASNLNAMERERTPSPSHESLEGSPPRRATPHSSDLATPGTEEPPLAESTPYVTTQDTTEFTTSPLSDPDDEGIGAAEFPPISSEIPVTTTESVKAPEEQRMQPFRIQGIRRLGLPSTSDTATKLFLNSPDATATPFPKAARRIRMRQRPTYLTVSESPSAEHPVLPSMLFPGQQATTSGTPSSTTTTHSISSSSTSFSQERPSPQGFFRRGGEDSALSSEHSTPHSQHEEIHATPRHKFAELKTHLASLVQTPQEPTATSVPSSPANASFSSTVLAYLTPEELREYLASMPNLEERLNLSIELLNELRVTNNSPEEVQKLYTRSGIDNKMATDIEINEYINAILHSFGITNRATLKTHYTGPLRCLNLPIINWAHIATYQPTGGLHYCSSREEMHLRASPIFNITTGCCGALHHRNKYSSFFPIGMPKTNVIQIIKNAFANQIAFSRNIILGHDRDTNIYVEMYAETDCLIKLTSAFPILFFIDMTPAGEPMPVTLERSEIQLNPDMVNRAIFGTLQQINNLAQDITAELPARETKNTTRTNINRFLRYFLEEEDTIIIDIAPILEEQHLLLNVKNGFYIKIKLENPIYTITKESIIKLLRY